MGNPNSTTQKLPQHRRPQGELFCGPTLCLQPDATSVASDPSLHSSHFYHNESRSDKVT